MVSRSPDFTARKALGLTDECVMQLASAPGRSTGPASTRASTWWIPQQTAFLPQGSSPEYFRPPSQQRRPSTLVSTCCPRRAVMCVCDQQPGLEHSIPLCFLAASTAPGAHRCGLGSDVSSTLPLNTIWPALD